jgi:hypothetical protein
MALDPKFNDKILRVALGMAALAVVLAILAGPAPASAALRGAAGGKSGGGGFSRFVEFINHLADYTIPIGSAFSVLELIWGGLLFQAGDQRAGRVLGFVALGVGIVLLSKPIAA